MSSTRPIERLSFIECVFYHIVVRYPCTPGSLENYCYCNILAVNYLKTSYTWRQLLLERHPPALYLTTDHLGLVRDHFCMVARGNKTTGTDVVIRFSHSSRLLERLLVILSSEIEQAQGYDTVARSLLVRIYPSAQSHSHEWLPHSFSILKRFVLFAVSRYSCTAMITLRQQNNPKFVFKGRRNHATGPNSEVKRRGH